MEFGKAFTFVFDDPDWLKKIILTALISLIPLIGQIYLIGYGLEVGRRVIRREAPLLPNVAFGECLSLGLKAFLIGLVYAIPAIILTLPISIASVLVSSNGNGSEAGPVMIAVSVCYGGLAVLYGLALWIWIPAAHGNFLATGNIGAAFRFHEIFALLKAAPGAYLMVLLGGLIGGLIAPLGTIACGIGVLLTSTYVVVYAGHLYGQAYNAAIANKALM